MSIKVRTPLIESNRSPPELVYAIKEKVRVGAGRVRRLWVYPHLGVGIQLSLRNELNQESECAVSFGMCVYLIILTSLPSLSLFHLFHDFVFYFQRGEGLLTMVEFTAAI